MKTKTKPTKKEFASWMTEQITQGLPALKDYQDLQQLRRVEAYFKHQEDQLKWLAEKVGKPLQNYTVARLLKLGYIKMGKAGLKVIIKDEIKPKKKARKR